MWSSYVVGCFGTLGLRIWVLKTHGCESSKEHIKGMQRLLRESLDEKGGKWTSKKGIKYFTNPGSHENSSFSTFVKSTFSSTNENR